MWSGTQKCFLFGLLLLLLFLAFFLAFFLALTQYAKGDIRVFPMLRGGDSLGAVVAGFGFLETVVVTLETTYPWGSVADR